MEENFSLLPPIRLRSNATLQPSNSLEGHDVACTYKVTHADKKAYPKYDVPPSEPAFDSHPQQSVPSLMVLCVRRLVPLVHDLDKSTLYDTWTPRRYETIREVVHDLLPSVLFDESVDSQVIDAALSGVHPNKWLLLHLLVIPSSLPRGLQRYRLPLSDAFLPSLQTHSAINSSNFELITALLLGDNDVRVINDDNISTLQALHHLTILDTSGTMLTSRGVRRFASTLRRVDEEGYSGEAALRGPWRLRVWNLRRTYVDNDILTTDLGLRKWPLLCAVDIRQTKCIEPAISLFRNKWGCNGTDNESFLFDPVPPLQVVNNLVALLPGHGKESRLAQAEFALLIIDCLDHSVSVPTKPSSPSDTACANPATLVLTGESIIRGTVTEVREEVAFRVECPKVSPLTTMSGMPLGRRPTLVPPRLPTQGSVFRRHLTALPPACNGFLLWRTPPPAHLALVKQQSRAETGFKLRHNSENCRTEKRKRASDETLYVVKKLKTNLRHNLLPLEQQASRLNDGISNTNPFATRSFS